MKLPTERHVMFKTSRGGAKNLKELYMLDR